MNQSNGESKFMTPSIDQLDEYLTVKSVEQGIPIVDPKTDFDKFVNMSFEDL